MSVTTLAIIGIFVGDKLSKHLDGNKLKTVPASISQLTNLKTLGLVGNAIAPAEQEKIKAMLPNAQVYF